MMDSIQRSYFSQCFEIQYLKAEGDIFQDLFRRIMEAAYPSDFITVRPYGNLGDLKCDGYQVSTATVFQCYAPRDMKLAKLTAKMTADFYGAVKHWAEQMKIWVFVHNDRQGIPANAVQLLNTFSTDVKTVSNNHWAFEELKNIVMELPVGKLESLFGFAPSRKDIIEVNNGDIDLVIRAVQRMTPDPTPPLRAPSTEKINVNNLSPDVQALLVAGRMGEPRVTSFLETYPDPGFGEAIAETFRSKYSELKKAGLDPDLIFDELFSFVGGDVGGAKRKAAALAVLSYFFERCDIFEEPVSLS